MKLARIPMQRLKKSSGYAYSVHNTALFHLPARAEQAACANWFIFLMDPRQDLTPCHHAKICQLCRCKLVPCALTISTPRHMIDTAERQGYINT